MSDQILGTIPPEEARRLRERGEEFQNRVVEAIKKARRESARSQQSSQRVLGMSDLGGCREFIRATLAGDPKKDWDTVKWGAEWGTAIGDHVETILQQEGWETQGTVSLTLPRTGIVVTGHLDEIDTEKDEIADNKTVDGTADVRRDGPSDKNMVQISGYLVAAVQAKKLTEEAVGHLIYFDRAGKEPPYTWTVNYSMALVILDWVEERLLDVSHALERGSREDRQGRLMTDEPESWCSAIGCPFYDACYAGYTPTGRIEHPRQLEAVARFIAARDDEKDAMARRRSVRSDLQGVEGIVEHGPYKGTIVRWTLSDGGRSDRLDVRLPKK